MEGVSKAKQEKNGNGEILVRRGCAISPPSQASSIPSFLATQQLGSKTIEQCDSGFDELTDDSIRRLESEAVELKRLEEDRRVKTLEETTQNLRIDTPEETDAVADRQPNSVELDWAKSSAPLGGHFRNYAESNNPRYLVAQVREQFFLQDEDGDTPLHLAVIHAQHQAIDVIVSVAPCQESLNIFNDLRQTPLHLAVITKQPTVVRRLLEAGANVDLRDRNGKTALHLACERGDSNCVQEITRPLLEKQSFSDEDGHRLQAVLDARDYQGFTALHRAVLANCVPVVGHLAAIGADVNCQDGTSGRTPIHHAVEQRNLGMTRFLMFDCKADVDAATFDESTPLHIAAGRGMKSLVALLLAAGANPTVTNYEGESPKDHAMEEVAEMLMT